MDLVALAADLLEHLLAREWVAWRFVEQAPHFIDHMLTLGAALLADRSPLVAHLLYQFGVLTFQKPSDLIEVQRCRRDGFLSDSLKQGAAPPRALGQELDRFRLEIWLQLRECGEDHSGDSRVVSSAEGGE